jgi:hypothetical protein
VTSLDVLPADCNPAENYSCEHCGKPFARRERSGGRPQRFCSSECRTAFHSGNRNVPQRSPTCSVATEVAATPVPETAKATQEAAEAKLAAILAKREEDRFDWWKDDSIVVERQMSIAIYFNSRGHLVVRQEAEWNEDEDTFIYIAPQNIAAFIDRLCDVGGIPSAGKR